ncbi:MAG: CCA tRNA nucleotidyltransferase [Geminicoccaceae bacterium]
MTTPLAGAPWLTAESSRKLMDVLTASGAEARFVGGCVRDALLGKIDADVDLDVATGLLPDQIIERLEAAEIKAIPTGIAHGTVTAIIAGQSFEITTLRKDVACDGRHADVQFTDDFELDAKRRDFTINAMSTDRLGRLFDYFGGVEDLKAGRIRFVGNAEERVREDYLRILRFFRFYARFGRPPADQQALQACKVEAAGLARLSGERIRSEMLKLLASGNAVTALTLMSENKTLRHVLPINVDLDALTRLIAVAPDSDPLLRLAALLKPNTTPKSTLAAVAAWRMSKAEAARLESLVMEPLIPLPISMSEGMKKIYRLGEETYLDLLKLSAKTTMELEAALPVPEIPALPITGQDLVDRQVRPGPALGELLKQLEDWWLDHDMQPDRAALLQELDNRLRQNPKTPQNP